MKIPKYRFIYKDFLRLLESNILQYCLLKGYEK